MLHESVEDLEKSIQSCCHLCTLIGDVLFDPYIRSNPRHKDLRPTDQWLPEVREQMKRDEEERKGAMRGSVWVKIEDSALRLICGSCDLDDMERWFSLDGEEQRILYLKAIREGPMINSAHTYAHTGSPEHIRLARFWLKECLAKHPFCIKPSHDFRPSRLIHLNHEKPGHVKLHVTKDADGVFTYCALSHCWGGAEDILVLTKDNIEQLCNSIDIAQLAQTFRDTIRVAASLGISYLWIDSLCILQDCEEDWVLESAKMSKIYENAICTIAAEDAFDSHQGFLVNRNPLKLVACKVFGSLAQGLFANSPRNVLAFMGRRSKLQSRAWAFQEGMLARRTLHFTNNKIRWSCMQGVASELVVNGHSGDKDLFGLSVEVVNRKPERLFKTDIYHFGNGIDYINYEKKGNKAMGTSSVQFNNMWFSIVSEYSQREMTLTKDKLVALSAVAERMKSTFGYKYCAGLWEEHIIANMLWRIDNPRAPDTRAPYRAPSWSWAARDGFVSWYHVILSGPSWDFLVRTPRVTLSTHPKDESRTGSVYDGKCSLRGYLKSVSRFRWILCYRGDQPSSLRFFDGEKVFGIFDPDVAMIPDIANLFLIPLAQESFSYGSRSIIHGLGVRMSSDGTSYERVGFFSFEVEARYASNADVPDLNWFKDGAEQNIDII